MNEIILNIKSLLFYLKNRKKGITKDFSFYLYDQKIGEKVIPIVSSSKNFEDLCAKLREEFKKGEESNLPFDLLASMPYGVFTVTTWLFVNQEMALSYLKNQISVSEQKEIITKYKEFLFEYIQSSPDLRNQFFRGSDTNNPMINNLRKDITIEDLDFVIEKLFEANSNFSSNLLKNIYLVKNLLFEMETLYPKEILFSSSDFVKFEMETGSFKKYIICLKNKQDIPSLEERLEIFSKEKNLTPYEKELLNNKELLLERLKKITFPEKEEVIANLEQAIKDLDTIELLKVLEEYSMLYETEYRKQILSSLYTPTSSCIVTDFRDVKPIMIHGFLRDPSNFFQKYMETYKESLIKARIDGNASLELTPKEQQQYENHLEYARKYLFNQTYIPETASFENCYSDANGFSYYQSDTSNQLSTSVIGLSEIVKNIGLYGVGFDSSSVPAENIALSSPFYLTTNKGLYNLEISPEDSFSYTSASLDELLESWKNEVVLFRKGEDNFTKASYVFAIISGEKDEYSAKRDQELIEKVKKIAEDNNMKLIIFDAFKIWNSYELSQQEEVELEEKKR